MERVPNRRGDLGPSTIVQRPKTIEELFGRSPTPGREDLSDEVITYSKGGVVVTFLNCFASKRMYQ